MNEKSKFQKKMPVLLFFVLWIGVFTLGWAMTVLGIFEISAIIPQPIRNQMRELLPFGLRSTVKIMLFPCIGLIIAAAQAYLLNRAFSLRLDWRWTVVTTLAYAVWLLPALTTLLRDLFPHPLSEIFRLAYLIFPSFCQWFFLRTHWRFSWLWILAALPSALGIWLLSFLISDSMFYDAFAATVREIMPIGFTHGLITGLTILLMNWLTTRFNKTHQATDKI